MACKEQISMVLNKLEQGLQAISSVVLDTKNKEERKKNIAIRLQLFRLVHVLTIVMHMKHSINRALE